MRSAVVLLLLVFFASCTDYVAQIDEEYESSYYKRAKKESSSSTLNYNNESSGSFYQSSVSQTPIYNEPSSSSVSQSTVGICNEIYTYDPKTEFCSKASGGNYIVLKFCETSCWSSDRSECSSCLKGVSCNGFPYNPKKFACVSGKLYQLCNASYFGLWFEALRNSCI
jgi:hypothetical protein